MRSEDASHSEEDIEKMNLFFAPSLSLSVCVKFCLRTAKHPQ